MLFFFHRMKWSIVWLDRVATPLVLFAGVYLAAASAGWLGLGLISSRHSPEYRAGVALSQWIALVAVVAASAACIMILEKGRWDLGLSMRAIPIGLGAAGGAALAAAILAPAHLLILLSTEYGHSAGGGFPWIELVAIYLPAVLHEELLFRGYAFQKLVRWRSDVAVILGAVLFAVLHLGNRSVGQVALLNIALAGVLLSLAYLVSRSLWLPIGTHLFWNLFSGPVLGHEISGYEPARTMLIEIDPGPAFLTGGQFGIEGSIWMTLTELSIIALLLVRMRSAKPLLAVPDPPHVPAARSQPEEWRD